MSSTVKRVMIVMMSGLVAMLGSKAEAHLIIKNGKGYICTHCFNAEAEEDHEGSVNFTDHFELIEYLVMTKKTELLCPKGVEDSQEQMNLFAKKQVEEGDITRVLKDDGTPTGLARADVVARISDLPLMEDLNCGDLSKPTDVLVRQAEVVITSKVCTSKTTCEVFSSLSLGVCTLPSKFNLKEYPKNLPPIGARLDCKNK